jgi:hypothetical protein
MCFVARVLTALAFVALALPASAAARFRTIAPPGNPAISQYLETVPTDKGQSPTSSGGQQGGALTAQQRAALESRGANGTTLVAVVDASSPPPAASHRGRGASRHAGGGIASAALSDRGTGSPATSVLAAADGSGGMGIFLPGLMVVVVVGVTASVAVRWRRSRPS